MTALAADRNTPGRTGEEVVDPVAASTKLYAGGLVCLDASGNAVPGSTSTTLKARGVAQEQVDNSDGAAGDLTIKSKKGLHRFVNYSSDAIDRADIGSDCYIVDDQTVAATSGSSTRSVAGEIVDVDDYGVWVKIA